ncbi:hypothetical protein H2200_006724 [Cladophialophora chaetospira]|uniref:MINDY deubiquitinase domain-containing protein n=1 Tax=Cladophialophora chaetospira TaxID=386627 RepID=A0AA39CI02_9EURO|nr:hypothetical protein H2200_006724 [Cladophialophora chaetospira]
MTRKSSLPYPASPPPPPLFPSDNAKPPHHSSGGPTRADGSNFHEADNPWSDVPGNDLRSDRPLPDFLKAGQSRPPQDAAAGSLSKIPNVLRAGHSQEDTPRSSLESDRSKGFWEDSDDEQGQGRKSPKKDHIIVPDGDPSDDPWVNVESADDKSSGIKRKPVGSGLSPAQTRLEPNASTGFASNNPFRRPSEQLHDPDWGQTAHSIGKGKEPDRGTDLPPVDRFEGLTVGNSALPDLSSYNAHSQPQSSAETWGRDQHVTRPPPMPQAPPPPVPPEPQSPFSRQAPLIPVSPNHAPSENPWASNPRLGAPTPSPIPFSPSQKQVSTYTDDLLDRGPGQESGVVSLAQELETLPDAAQQTGTVALEEPSLLDDDDDIRPPLPSRPPQHAETEYFAPPEGPPPSKAHRPIIHTTVPSDEEVARMIEQRNETYQIKHFNWFDHSSQKLRKSSMLTQNKNGPCPLLALVNALILGATDESQAALDDALRTREQVSLGLIIETLMDELLSRGFDAVEEVMPDVDELNHFLMRLRTGMNANPRFVPPAMPSPNLMDADESMLGVPQHQRAQQRLGTFEATPDMKLYGAFQVPLIHGWLPKPGSDAAKAFSRSAQTYEDAQALQFGEEELEYKLSRQGLSEAEQNMWQDINSIKNFLVAHPTQLTPTGLEAVQDSIPSGSFAIMFRNDHFSTIYKHPDSGQLFTLITDAGYADRDEIIWESLVDISGKHNEFFSGDFMPVSHNTAADDSSTHPAARRTSQLLTVDAPTSAAPMSPQEQQEQHDADFAMALQLQEEEEQRQRAERNRRRSSGNAPTSNPQQGRRPQAGHIPIPLRSSQQQQPQQQQPPQHQAPEVRPPMPPRTSQAAERPGVTRPSDAAAEDAPPAYEEAAKGRPYIPPIGSPLHPQSEPSPMNSNTQLTGTVSNTSTQSATMPGGYDPPSHPPGPNANVIRRDPRRRLSAYNETQQFYGPQQRLHPQSALAGPSGPGRMGRGRDDRDCIVM